MSEDLSNGHVALPRRIALWPLAGLIATVVALSFGFGGWAWAIESRVDEHDELLRRVAAYMCMDCAVKGVHDCRYICGSEGP